MTKENLYTPNCIRTFTGLYINVFEPMPEMICIEDIAHALSKEQRFGNHLPMDYSVAEHSCICAGLVSRENKLAALLHDSAEAYLKDFPKPIKDLLPEYKKLEHNLLTVISKKFGFEYPLHEDVKNVDKYMLELEWENIMLIDVVPPPLVPQPTKPHHDSILGANLPFYFRGHKEMKERFLDTFEYLQH